MGLIPGGAPATPPAVAEVPRDRWGQPLIVPPEGGKPVAYTRASSLGKVLESTYALGRWQQRAVALGMGRRTDLVALASAIRTNAGDDRAALDDIADRAREAVATNKGADVGTALHTLSEQRDAGEDLSHLPGELRAALDAYTDIMAGLRVLGAETFVVHDGLTAAGTYDRVVTPREGRVLTAPDGTVYKPGDALVLDLKTGKVDSTRYWGAGYAVQQYVYAHGRPYRPDGERLPWSDVLYEPNARPCADWSLILHVPGDSPADAGLVWVNLDIARHLADLASEVRRASRVKGLFAPASVEQVAQLGEDLLISCLREAVDEDALDALWQEYQDSWTPAATQAVKARLAELDKAGP